MAQASSNDVKNWGSKISLDCPFKEYASLLLLALEGVELVAAVSLVHALHKLRVDDEPLPLGLLLLLLLLPHFLRLSRLLLSIRLDKKLVT